MDAQICAKLKNFIPAKVLLVFASQNAAMDRNYCLKIVMMGIRFNLMAVLSAKLMKIMNVRGTHLFANFNFLQFKTFRLSLLLNKQLKPQWQFQQQFHQFHSQSS